MNSRDYKRNPSDVLHKDYIHSNDNNTKMCPYCGRNINPFFVICPFCHFDLRDISSYDLCEECGRIIKNSDEVCPGCEVTSNPHESLPEVVDLCDEGFKLIENYKIKEAKICFDKASKIDSRDVNPVVGNAYCLYYLGYYVLAFKEYDKALKMDPSSIDEAFYNDLETKVDSIKG